MYERRHEPLLPMRLFIYRMLRNAGFALGLILGSLGLGMWGYRVFGGLSWIDALLNASMLLGGMGPVNVITSTSGKLFASFYALFAGLVFLVAAGVFFAPLYHRFLHRFHLDIRDD